MAFPVSIKSHDFSADAVPTPKHPSGVQGSISFTDTNLSERHSSFHVWKSQE